MPDDRIALLPRAISIQSKRVSLAAVATVVAGACALVLGLPALEVWPMYIAVMVLGGSAIVGGAGVLRRRLWARPLVFAFSATSGLLSLSCLVGASLYSDELSGRAFLLVASTFIFAYSLWCVYLFRPLRWFRPQSLMADFGFSSVIRISVFVFIICFLLILLPLIH